MDLKPGMRVTEIPIDRAFIGTCTNGRIEDLRAAAAVLRGRKAVVPAWVSPGSTPIKRQAEAEGLDRIFTEAGFEWRAAGCSMCVAGNGDVVPPGKRCISSSNRNFEGRQGPQSHTHLASPAMVAAAAVSGVITDVRKFGWDIPADDSSRSRASSRSISAIVTSSPVQSSVSCVATTDHPGAQAHPTRPAPTSPRRSSGTRPGRATTDR